MVNVTGQLIWTPRPCSGHCSNTRCSLLNQPECLALENKHCFLVTMKSHFSEAVPVFDAFIPWLPLPCQGQNLGLSFQGRTKQFCFLGKWEVWDGECSIRRGDCPSWGRQLPSLTLSQENRNQTQHSIFLSSQWTYSVGLFKFYFKKHDHRKKTGRKQIKMLTVFVLE